jgi:hypothetical protein
MDWLVNLVMEWIGKDALGIAGILYIVGIAFKGLRDIVESIIKSTETTKDDEWFAKLLDNKVFKLIEKILDYAIRIKIPRKK